MACQRMESLIGEVVTCSPGVACRLTWTLHVQTQTHTYAHTVSESNLMISADFTTTTARNEGEVVRSIWCSELTPSALTAPACGLIHCQWCQLQHQSHMIRIHKLVHVLHVWGGRGCSSALDLNFSFCRNMSWWKQEVDFVHVDAVDVIHLNDLGPQSGLKPGWMV